MSTGIGRMAASLRPRRRNSQAKSKDAAQEDHSAGQAAASVDAAYAAGLTMLGNKRAAGELDNDLALAAARRLGHLYRQRQSAGDPAVAENHLKKVEQIAGAAIQARSQLVGTGRHDVPASLLSELDAAIGALRQYLTDLRKDGDAADQHNKDRPVLEQRLPTGWEPAVMDAAIRLQGIARRIGELASAHAKAVADHERERR